MDTRLSLSIESSGGARDEKTYYITVGTNIICNFVMLLNESSCSSVDSRPTENNVTEYKKITAEEAKARMRHADMNDRC